MWPNETIKLQEKFKNDHLVSNWSIAWLTVHTTIFVQLDWSIFGRLKQKMQTDWLVATLFFLV